uniref:Uncharacterized protein n=1 Tax=Candidatus Kentrum sp. LPFa TaxID=2126335 RepID=A0A450XW59_9GAMM|nr:MAG: hypothetical protein BECKLPF1236A_GA0070988_100225 [Candidatus Kentron sp. LPFa]VFK33529.1 MAG: hypothetical protein BECKLPF1236C_GA0070990_102123 [Candidatus Kentron sp. LPFa]
MLLATTMVGCADLAALSRQTAQPQIQSEDLGEFLKDDGKKEHAGKLAVWPPYTSAAIIDGQGNRCVLAASGAKTIDASSEATLKLGKALEKIETLDASIKSQIIESFTKITAADEHAAFVDIALFHLCILDQNGTFKKNDWKAKEILNAYLETIDAATLLGQTKTVKSPGNDEKKNNKKK